LARYLSGQGFGEQKRVVAIQPFALYKVYIVQVHSSHSIITNRKPMNILFLCDEYPPGKHGGIGTAVQTLANELAAKGHTITVAGFYDKAYGGESHFKDGQVEVYRFYRKLYFPVLQNQGPLFVRAIYRLLTITGVWQRDIEKSLVQYHAFLEQLIHDKKIDIVEAPDYNDYIRFCNRIINRRPLSIPMVVKLHGSISYFTREEKMKIPQRIWHMERQFLQQAVAVAGVSKYTAHQTARYLEYPHAVEVLYNGIEVPIATGIKKEHNRVIFTGSLAEKKGIYQLMRAWNIVLEKVPTAELWVFGKGPIAKVQAELNTTDRRSVLFKGHVPGAEIYRQLSAATVAVFPSYAECFALGPMEAMACNTAVIYTERTSGPELITDGVNGYLIDPDDTTTLANKIIYLLQHPDIATTIAAKGRETICERFDIRLIAEQHVAFYEKALNIVKTPGLL